MGQQPLRVGVIGFGKMGILHAGVVNGLAASELVAVADVTSTLLSAFKASKPQVATYKDYEKMLDGESLEAAFIACPTFLHVPVCLSCVERGVPFLVEKPLASTSAAAEPLLAALKKGPVTNMVGYMSRQIDTFAKAKQLLASEPLGKLMHLRATMYVSQLFRRGKGWRYDKKLSGGGVLITQNSHLIDLLQWYFGPVEWVCGQTKSWFSKSVEDFAHAYLGFKSGLTGYIDTSWSARHHRTVDVRIDAQGENGTLTVSDDEVKLFLDRPRDDLAAGWTLWRKPDLYRGVALDVGNPEYTRQDAEFLSAVATGGTIECDVLSAYRVQQVIDAIYGSAERGGSRVKVSKEA